MTAPRFTPPARREGLGAWVTRYPGPRALGWVELNALCCPLGHRIKRDAVLFTDGVIRCKHRPAAGQGECGKLLYLVACLTPRSPESEPRLCFAVEITYEELREIERERLGTLDVLARLGTSLPLPATVPIGDPR